MYQLRIDAEVKVVELEQTDISAYAYERTMLMQTRNEVINLMKKGKKKGKATIPDSIGVSGYSNINGEDPSQQTWTGAPPQMPETPPNIESVTNIDDLFGHKPDQRALRRMHCSVRLNEVIVTESHDAKLVILNLPGPPKKDPTDADAHEK